MQVKALAGELPQRLGLPLSRLSLADIRQEARAQGLVAQVSSTTLWRWLSADALRPWRHRSWIFPRDPDCARKAGRILDLYARTAGKANPYRVLSSSSPRRKKPAFQRDAVSNLLGPLPPADPGESSTSISGQGAGTYWAAWDVHRAKLFGHGEKKSGIAPTDRLIAEVMRREPYQSAQRIFLDPG